MKRRLFILLGLSNFGHAYSITQLRDNIGILSPPDPFTNLDYLGIILLFLDALINVLVFYWAYQSGQKEVKHMEAWILGFLITTILSRYMFLGVITNTISDPRSVTFLIATFSPFCFGMLLQKQRELDEIYFNNKKILRSIFIILEWMNKISGIGLAIVVLVPETPLLLLDLILGLFVFFLIVVKISFVLPTASGIVFLLYGINNKNYYQMVDTYPQYQDESALNETELIGNTNHHSSLLSD